MKYAALLLAALVLVLGLQPFGRAEPPLGVQRWEYKQWLVNIAHVELSELPDPAAGLKRLDELGIQFVEADQFKRYLTEAGAEGWELASVEGNHWIFKRPVK